MSGCGARQKLYDIAISGAEDRGISEALWRLDGGTPNPAVTISANAQKIAEVFHPIRELAKLRQNEAGARIGNATDFVTSTNWDQRQLRLAAGKGRSYDEAYQAWKARDVPRMAAKTFDQVSPKEGETMDQARERFLRSVFEATELGVHMAFMGDDAASSYTPMAFEGTRNVARSLSHQRVVYWKSADDWLAHQREFGGGGTLVRQITNSLDIAGRNTGVMMIWGTNPTGNLNTIIRRVQEKYRTHENLERFNGELDGLRHSLGWLDGTNNIGLNADRARRVNYFMTLEGLSHLGGVAITHLFSAPATFGSEMAHHGVSQLESLGNIVSATLTGRAEGEKAEIMADAGSYAHGFLLDIASHREAGDGLPGWVTQKAAQFMRLTGLPRTLERLQTDAVKSVLMTRLGRDAGKEFGQLIPEQAQILSRYGIGAREWDLLRGVAPTELGGQRYISPSDSPKISDAAAALHLGLGPDTRPDVAASAMRSLRWDIGDRYLSYLNDAAEHAAVTPGVREKSLMLRNFAPGSVPWMAMRLFAQFKMWPIAFVNQVINREIASIKNLTPGRVVWNVGTLLTLATIGGSLRMALNDFAVGNPQRNWRDPVTLLAGLAQGGGLGIYGDFLFGEANRMGSGLAGTVMGPAGSDLDRLATMASRFRADLRDNPDHAIRHIWPDLVHFLVGHVPFGNLIYLKGALDYLLWYHLYDTASPGGGSARTGGWRKSAGV